MTRKVITVGITGASGVVYGVRLVEELLRLGHKVHLVITDAGWQVLQQEIDLDTLNPQALLKDYFEENENLFYHEIRDFHAPIASGSYYTDAMVVVPCSMGTLSGISHGASGNLLERAADVALKEGKQLILVPRETPLNTIHIENMLRAAKAGINILPAMPGFYHKPKDIEELIKHLVGKILASLNIKHTLFTPWGE